MLKIGVTGAFGNLGKVFCKTYKKKFKINKFTGNIIKKKDVDSWIKSNNFNAIIHLAAIVPVNKVESNYPLALKVNQIGTRNLLISINKYNAKLNWLFYASTSHVYKENKKKIIETSKIMPSSLYGKSKLLGEKEIISRLKNTDIKYCIGRIFSIIDNNNNFFFLNNLKAKFQEKKKEKIFLNNLNHYRDFINTTQISSIIYGLLQIKYNGIINIASGKRYFLKKIAFSISKKYKKKIFIKKNKRKTIIVANVNKLKSLKLDINPININDYI